MNIQFLCGLILRNKKGKNRFFEFGEFYGSIELNFQYSSEPELSINPNS
jgi:hypothetical protein